MNQKEIERANRDYSGSMTQCDFDKKGHEVYGEKPKMFSKEWWPYFRDYYKFHTIAAVIVLLLIIITVHQMRTSIDYDCNIIYVGAELAADDASFPDGVIENVTKDDAVNIRIESMPLSTGERIDEYTMAMQQKFMIELAEGESYLYILDENAYNNYIVNTDESAFSPCTEWLEAEVDDSRLAKKGDTAYGVRVDESKALSDLGLDPHGKIIVIRSLYERNSKDELHVGLHKNAISAANYIAAE